MKLLKHIHQNVSTIVIIFRKSIVEGEEETVRRDLLVSNLTLEQHHIYASNMITPCYSEINSVMFSKWPQKGGGVSIDVLQIVSVLIKKACSTALWQL